MMAALIHPGAATQQQGALKRTLHNFDIKGVISAVFP
jgi:hypothetical protein